MLISKDIQGISDGLQKIYDLRITRMQLFRTVRYDMGMCEAIINGYQTILDNIKSKYPEGSPGYIKLKKELDNFAIPDDSLRLIKKDWLIIERIPEELWKAIKTLITE